MEFSFECGCGEAVTGKTRGDEPRFDTRMSCPACDTVYAITVTTIDRQFDEEVPSP